MIVLRAMNPMKKSERAKAVLQTEKTQELRGQGYTRLDKQPKYRL
jgi:hypothetical protein